MEGIKDVALAHYENFPGEEKETVHNEYKEMVANGSVSQYFSFHLAFCSETVNECIKSCKEYKEASLDFNNFITIKYILEYHSITLCNECSLLISGKNFFSCYECFISDRVWNLCCNCYRSKMSENHDHNIFYDNQTMLCLSWRMSVEQKRDRRERDIEQVLIGCASAFLNLAGEIKTNGLKDTSSSRGYEFDLKERLGEISRLAKELEQMTNAKEDKIESSEEEKKDILGEKHLYEPIDILGAKATALASETRIFE